MDEVDRIVAAWRHERPDLDVSPMEILSRVSRLARQLDLARKTSFSDYGIEGWAFDVLSALRRSGEPYQLSPSTLLQETLVTSGTMTNRIDRLGARGWVERRPDPGDRRGVLAQPTASRQPQARLSAARTLHRIRQRRGMTDSRATARPPGR